MVVEVEAWCNDGVEVGHLHTVLVDGATILKQGSRVTKGKVAVEHGQVIVGI